MSIQYWNPTAMVVFARSLIWTIPGAIGMVAYVYLVGKLTNQVTSKGNNWLKKGIQQCAQVINPILIRVIYLAGAILWFFISQHFYAGVVNAIYNQMMKDGIATIWGTIDQISVVIYFLAAYPFAYFLIVERIAALVTFFGIKKSTDTVI